VVHLRIAAPFTLSAAIKTSRPETKVGDFIAINFTGNLDSSLLLDRDRIKLHLISILTTYWTNMLNFKFKPKHNVETAQL
jgi:hypothetical protein